ncbi:hypothetical protein [Argonema galeatum]|nr:hypothetical protein [Argonema galeatum]MCL1466112.1 hypothetical protein [Argonema galeatum A003/A1]
MRSYFWDENVGGGVGAIVLLGMGVVMGVWVRSMQGNGCGCDRTCGI